MRHYYIFSKTLITGTSVTACLSLAALTGCGGGVVPTATPASNTTPADNSSGNGQVTPASAGLGQDPGGTSTGDSPASAPEPATADPTITPAGGTFQNSVTVTLACATDGATIVYTTDGTTPSTDGTTPTGTSALYTAPFAVTRSRVLMVKAVKQGYSDSNVVSANFVIQITGQLLVNGSFEDGPDPGPFTALFPPSTAIPGWTVINGGIDWIGTYRASSDGTRSLDLDGSPGFGGVAQTFPTISGHSYKVSFDMAGNIDDDPKPIKSLRVEADGQTGDFQFDITGHTDEALGWTRHDWSFTANAASTTLKIYSTDKTGGWGGPLLDNVAVVDTTPVTP